MNCIFCKAANNFQDELDLGDLYSSAFVPLDFDYSKARKLPTKLVSCKQCGFVQMSETPDQDSMYREYWYRSSLNATMIDSLADVIAGAYKRYPSLHNGFQCRALDIGSNDGTLLSLYPKHWFRVGVDPATNLRKYYSHDNADVFLNDYFSSKWHFSRSFDIITSIAMFYDLLEPEDFVRGIKQNLDKHGIWVMQITDNYSMLKTNDWDNICSEHCAYWTLKYFSDLMKDYNLEVFDVEYNATNGCSLRTYVGHKGVRDVTLSVEEALYNEKSIVYHGCWKDLDNKITDFGNKIMSLLGSLRIQGVDVAGLGASTKANTLLQTWGISQNHLSCIGEVSKEKFGRFTIGSHIPIVSEQDMFATNPEYVFILIWQFTKDIVSRNQDYLNRGGKFIVPLPKPAIISKEGVAEL